MQHCIMQATLLGWCLVALAVSTVWAQPRQADVVGVLSGGVVKYRGDFTDDMYGPLMTAGLRYAPLDRLWVEGRFGIGEYRWKVNQSRIAAYPDYFGQGASIGDVYPGTLTTIESLNASRMTTGDLLVHYVLVPDIPASVTLTAGVGVMDFSPSNDEQHSALPNNIARVYDRTVASIILGGGVHIPISWRVGLQFSGEHRFVFSRWLDDVDFNGSDDAISTFSIGFTYRFNDPDPAENPQFTMDCCDDVENCACECDDDMSCNCNDMLDCCSDRLCDCGKCVCCCCCCCGQQGGSGATASTPAAPAPPAPPAPGPATGGGGQVPEPMDVPCPKGQHRECFGPPGYGICVDDEPPRGPEPIRWDLAETLPDGSLLRSTDGKWYRKQVLPSGEVRVTKGNLPFEASECKECKEKAEKR